MKYLSSHASMRNEFFFSAIFQLFPHWNEIISNFGDPASESKSPWLSPRRAYQRFSSSFPLRRFYSNNVSRDFATRKWVSSNVQLDLYNLSVLPAVSRSAYHLIKRRPSTFVTHISSGCGVHTALMHRHFEYFILSCFAFSTFFKKK